VKRENLKLYFVALVPEGAVFDKVLALKKEVYERFGSRAALRSPPHVTLHMPFQWQEEKEGRLVKSLDALAKQYESMELVLEDFAAFPPRVIYLKVIENEALSKLQGAVQKNAKTDWHLYPKADSRPFKPHMTIAFRDLSKPRFFEAWDEFQHRKFSARFNIHDLCLLKHNGKSWDIAHRSPMNS
jgi:2'-5' RNA ligase